MIVLFSLVLAVGMLVDNAVVVIENIYRHIQEGKEPLAAASFATREVGAAITVSTLTTVGAFFPLLFWPGIVGDFMFYLPLTVSIALAASLAVAFTINPVMAGTYLRPEGGGRPASALHRRLESVGDRFARSYQRSLTFALDHRALVVAGTVALFVAVMMLYGVFGHGIEFFPETEPNQILLDVEMPPGTRLEKTDAQVRDFEAALRDVPDLEVMAVGSGAGSQSDFGQEGGAGSQARLTLDLFDRKDREQSSFATMDLVRRRTAGVPGATVDVKRPEEGPPVGAPLSIEVRGDDFAVLGTIAARITDAIADVPGLVSLDSDFDVARPEVIVDVDRTEAARLGLTTRTIATTVRTAVNGTEASVYRYGDDEADVVVRLAEGARNSIEELSRLMVVSEDGDQVPLSAVATVRTDTALTSINHKDQKRVVTITGDVTSPELAGPMRQEAQARIAAMGDLLPLGYSIGYSGQSEDEEEAKAFLSKAFLYAVLVVLALMVAKFDSLAVPLIIITSVLMSMVGVLLGLMVTGLPFGIIMTGLGVISLAGIVVNNAIVLLDYGEQLRKRGGLSRRELLIVTGTRRLRPVLLTAITTILGLIPLATGFEFDFHTFAFATGGESSQWWRGMAVAVIFGLGFATFLTLILVPVLYDLLLDLRERRARRKARKGGEPVAEEETAAGEKEAAERDEVAAREALPI
jgi:multidrug efflux pump subunit AcrB